jgi:hypothetical protein
MLDRIAEKDKNGLEKLEVSDDQDWAPLGETLSHDIIRVRLRFFKARIHEMVRQ